MKAPSDGWDRDEREALEGFERELESLRERHERDLPLELLRAARHDALSPDVQADAAERLASDPWSRALVEGLDEAEPTLSADDRQRMLLRIQRQAQRPEARAWSMWLRPVLASMAVLAIAVAAWTWRSGSAPQTTPQPESQTAAATPPAQRYQMPLDKPDVMLSAAALTWRGAGSENRLLADLKPAVDAFRQDDYARATREFAALENRYPNSVEVFYYGGVSRLFVNDPAGAIAALERAGELADEAFSPHITWYRAIAEHRAGREADARAQLTSLCAGASERKGRACEALKQLGSGDAR